VNTIIVHICKRTNRAQRKTKVRKKNSLFIAVGECNANRTHKYTKKKNGERERERKEEISLNAHDGVTNNDIEQR
jgi:hypothetical protein